MHLDHLAVVAADLDTGCAWLEDRLGVSLQPGGRHPVFGTHNRLLGMGDIYLEVIAPDPEATPRRARWFGLDHAPPEPRLGNWLCRVDDIAAALARSPSGAGAPVALTRDALTWQIAVPDDGSLPLGAAWPTFLQWGAGVRHPAESLPDSGCRLDQLEIRHPDADAIDAALSLGDRRVVFRGGGPSGLSARISTPSGPVSI